MNSSIDAVALLPELILTATLVTVLLVDLWIGAARRVWLTAIAALGTSAALASAVVMLATGRHGNVGADAFVVDDFALFGKVVLIASTLAVIAMGAPREWKGEYLTLMLAGLLGATTIVSARELVTFVVAFELLALPGYMLTAWNKRSEHGFEAALKYFLLGAVATAVMLYGASLIYGVTGTTQFSLIGDRLMESPGNEGMVRVGVTMLVASIAFKLSAAPFHFWTPDAYQGAPLPVAAYLSVVSKVGGLLALMVLVQGPLADASDTWAPLLVVLAVASIVVGNVAALRQTDVVRMLAYSSIAQAGYALVPIALSSSHDQDASLSLESLLIFVTIFAVMNLVTFAALIALGRGTSLATLEGAFADNPWIAAALMIGLMSLAGIPPFGGWFAKLVIFGAALEVHDAAGIVLAAATAIGSVVGLFYYAAVVARMWRRSDAQVQASPAPALAAVVVVLSVAVVVFGILPGLVTGPVEAISLG